MLGASLSNLFADDFVFDDPLSKTTSAQGFISKTKKGSKQKSQSIDYNINDKNKIISNNIFLSVILRRQD